jgi:hypothetical protein
MLYQLSYRPLNRRIVCEVSKPVYQRAGGITGFGGYGR